MTNWRLVQCETWWGGTAPTTQVSLSAFTWIGVSFQVTVDGFIFGASHYNDGSNVPSRIVQIWNINDPSIERVVDTDQRDPKPGKPWQNTWFRKRYPVVAGTTYQVAFLKWVRYLRTAGGLTSPVTHNHITFLNSFQSTSIFPPGGTVTTNTNRNGIDVLFLPS